VSADLGPIPTAWKMETQEDKDEVKNGFYFARITILDNMVE
jgi:hypothetical protein